jgi:hypothetical protein
MTPRMPNSLYDAHLLFESTDEEAFPDATSRHRNIQPRSSVYIDFAPSVEIRALNPRGNSHIAMATKSPEKCHFATELGKLQ